MRLLQAHEKREDNFDDLQPLSRSTPLPLATDNDDAVMCFAL